jgi:hypothetical protein
VSARSPSPLWVRTRPGETGPEFANRVFGELHHVGWYAPRGGDPDDLRAAWHWTSEGTSALSKIDRALGVEDDEGIRPTRAIKLIESFDREKLIEMLRATDAVPTELSDDALCFCVWETLSLMRSYGLRVEVGSILSSRRPKLG